MTSQQTIVVTGLGIVSPIGIGKEPFWNALVNSQSGIRRLDTPDGQGGFRIAGVVADFDPKHYVRPRKSLKVMSREIQLGFAAADLAFADAGLREHGTDPERLGVIFGSTMIPCELDEMAGTYRDCVVDGQFTFDRWGSVAMAELFPLWMLKYLPNMPACHIGIGQDARGPNNTHTLGDVSTLSAMAESIRVLERGQADAIISGGVGSRLHPAVWVRSHMMGLSPRCEPPEDIVRPFDARRDGMIDGEGAAGFLFETERNAQARGATILARVLGYGAAFEPRRNGGPRTGSAIRQAIIAALRASKQSPSDVGCVIAHGLSTVEDDRLEALAIRDVLGDVPVTAPKSYFGYLGSGSGALETAAGVLALQYGQIPPTLNYQEPDPECPIRVVHGRPVSFDQRTCLILSHSAQGQAVAVMLAGA